VSAATLGSGGAQRRRAEVDNLDVLELEAQTVNEELAELVADFRAQGLEAHVVAEADMDTDAEIGFRDHPAWHVQVTLDGMFVVNKAEGDDDDFTLLEYGEFCTVEEAAACLKKELGNECA
jgi:hypothetical protein